MGRDTVNIYVDKIAQKDPRGAPGRPDLYLSDAFKHRQIVTFYATFHLNIHDGISY